MWSKTKSISVFAISLGAGGAEKTISLLLPELVKEYKVFLVLFQKDIHFKIPDEVELIVLNKNKNRIVSFFSIIKEYNRFLKSNKIEISISFLTRPNLINGIVKIFNKDLKTIISERCYPSIAYKSNALRFRLYKILIPLLYNKADHVFSNSQHINEDLSVNFGVKKPMAVIYNPIDKPEFDLCDLKGRSDGEFTIGWVGKMVKIKNPQLLIDSLLTIDVKYNAFFLGDGVLKEKLVSEINNRPIKFYGNVKDVNKYLRKAHCFVLSSNSEGFPNVILEAMACGLPVVSTNCMSGPLEILNNNVPVEIKMGEYFIGKYGILTNVGDVIGLSNAILRLNQDTKLLRKLTKASLERVKEYSVETTYKEIKILIDGLY